LSVRRKRKTMNARLMKVF